MKKQILIISMIAAGGVSAGIEWIDEHEPSFQEQPLKVTHEDVLVDKDSDPIFDKDYFAEVDFDLEESVNLPKKNDNSKDEIQFISHIDFDLEESFLSEMDFDLNDTESRPKKSELPKDEIKFISQLEFEIDEKIFAETDFDLDEIPSPAKGIDNPKEEIHFISHVDIGIEDNHIAEIDFDVENHQVSKDTHDEINFISHGVVHKEAALIEDPVLACAEMPASHEEIIQIGEVGPFSPFSINGNGAKIALVEDENAAPEMIYFPPAEDSQCGFYLSRKKISNGEYETFVKSTQHRPPPHWLNGEIPLGIENEPVVNVTYKDAFLYSIWAGKRLPNEPELSMAVRQNKSISDIKGDNGEWTSTPALSHNAAARGAAHLTINSELSRITYHKVYKGAEKESPVLDSNSYNGNTGFRTAINAPYKRSI